ncbi:MAG: phosphoribulokinase [Actinobacteria bacterium]|nr:phosphoribulokinase [Actinomycetota bacterium]MBV8395712.1 phosphoribulokinase [Actinomycetota bacterium]MBV8599305.1 phosphoribulokinase [Actinomycetota bacterium]
MASRPIVLGVVGDSAAGKTTLTRGLVRVLGEENVTHVCTDDYHCFDRKQRAERNITPLHPDCNYMDVMAQHMRHLHHGDRFLKPVYQHTDGTFGPLTLVEPRKFAVVEGLLGYYTEELRALYDVRVYLNPPEELRRKWKVSRDCSRRGYTTDQVLSELDRREPDSEAFIRPQQKFADICVSFQPNTRDDQEHLDAELILRPTLQHPDLTSVLDGSDITIDERDGDLHLHVPGNLDPNRGQDIENAIWQNLHFASHLRTERLGEFTIGTELHRSESLALVQMVVLYHLFTATASVALGGSGTRVPTVAG